MKRSVAFDIFSEIERCVWQARPGRVAGHHHARHPADEPEDPCETLAEALRLLAPRRHAVPRPRLRERDREHLGLEAPARDCGDEVAVVDLHGPRRPAGPGVAIAGRLPLRQPPLPHEPADRRAVPGAGLLLDEPVAGPPRRKYNSSEEITDLDEFLSYYRKNTFTVTGMAFQDITNLDAERLKRCRVVQLTDDYRLVPFCAYNTIYRQTNKRGNKKWR